MIGGWIMLGIFGVAIGLAIYATVYGVIDYPVSLEYDPEQEYFDHLERGGAVPKEELEQ